MPCTVVSIFGIAFIAVEWYARHTVTSVRTLVSASTNQDRYRWSQLSRFLRRDLPRPRPPPQPPPPQAGARRSSLGAHTSPDTAGHSAY